MHPCLYYACLGLRSAGLAQTKVAGRVTDTQHKPIPYVNIGILDKGIGTISNEDGSFSLQIPSQYDEDSITFSAIGYEMLTLHRRAGNFNAVTLREKVILLKEVTVTEKGLKPITKEFGNKYWEEPNGIQVSDTLYAGAALALLITPDLVPAFAVKSRLRVQLNTLGEYKIRFRILSQDSITGLPDEDLLGKSLIITSRASKDWLEVDLARVV